MGDLNYRLGNISRTEVLEMIEKHELNSLIHFDQLKEQMKFGFVFNGFSEAKINFPPTYKFDPGTTKQYDTSEKKRTPAWTDRILWKSTKKDQVVPLIYTCYEDLVKSDHKPVIGFYKIFVEQINTERQYQFRNEIIKELDKTENESLPDASVSTNLLNFDSVQYNVPQNQTIILKNEGRGIVQFSFTPQLDKPIICPDWIEISPKSGFLIPSNSIEINFKILINNFTLENFDTDKDEIQLEEILILHLEYSKDHFIVVNLNYKKSCFGMSLNSLVKHKYPVLYNMKEKNQIIEKKNKENEKKNKKGKEKEEKEKEKEEKEKEKEKNENENEKIENKVMNNLYIPKELWNLINYLLYNCINYPGIFMQGGIPEENIQIRNILNTQMEFKFKGSPLSVAESLLEFLYSLKVSVIPPRYYKMCLLSVGSRDQCLDFIKTLPKIHQNVLIYIILFLKELLKHQDKNKIKIESLAYIFSNVLCGFPYKNEKILTNRGELIRRKNFLIILLK
ncbi:type ii inositol 145-trisphosphate 5-phosphatase [Anaeramoeba flamelloides]|uniref:Type ii inositol 145-trisphosphate 5-phosphatase n=1 Tax=Anaeramoeba flamelloides TaxID=1746091 RepID=A0AAV8A0Z8_9EUKA|nr:type ii inositol 145-trisphosphate 5-phosphatase [Anaeramoeba flamelloides]